MQQRKYEIIEPAISSGAFGTTYYAINKEEEKLYVIKKIPLNKVNLSNIKSELEMLEKLKKNGCRKDILCLKEHDINFDTGIAEIVTEAFIEGNVKRKEDIKVTDMRKFMINLKFQLTEMDLIKIIRNLSSALEYLHSLGIAHSDIKPENLLINEKLEIQIIDFGLSCYKYCGTGGTLSYAAPEMLLILLKNIKALSLENAKKCDIFSMGLVFYELANLDNVSDLHLFSGQIKDRTNLAEVLLMFYQRKVIVSKYALNNDINMIINKMLVSKRLERIDSSQVKNELDRIYDDIRFKEKSGKFNNEMMITTPSSEDFTMSESNIDDLLKAIEGMQTGE